jgi:hypothetical protein
MRMPRHPALRFATIYVVPSLAAFALLGLVLTVVGYRHQSRPLSATFADVAAVDGGIRLYGVRAGLRSGTVGGWAQCGAGSYETGLRRTGDRLEVTLTYHPSPTLIGCGEDHNDYGPSSGLDTGMFVPVPGPAPTVVTTPGDAAGMRVIDSRLGPEVLLGQGQEAINVGRPGDRFGMGGTRESWTDWQANHVDVYYAVPHVGGAPADWLTSLDMGPADRWWQPEHLRKRVIPFRIDGERLRARVLARGASNGVPAQVEVRADDGRTVLRLEVDGPAADDLPLLLGRIGVRS